MRKIDGCQNNSIYYLNRSAAYFMIHKFEESLSDSLQALALDPQAKKVYTKHQI